ncbi:MAG TPA: hypothetical protein VLB46_16650 [Pyrinomonadaceae bacterium]|nr:hypothetical protein [Pyrinomonadaceae bacterium]
MSKAALASKETILTIVEQLIEISKLDTLFRDLYLQRARTLLGTFFGRGSYIQMKQNRSQIPLIEHQLRSGVEHSDWKRCSELTDRLRQLRANVEAGSQFAKLAETIYERAGGVAIDPFSSGMNVFVGAGSESLLESRAAASATLFALERSDPEKRDFYARRASDFKQLSLNTDEMAAKELRATDPAQQQQAALSALESGDLSKLDQILASFAIKTIAKPDNLDSADLKPTEADELGADLLYPFTEQTLAAARELGLTPVRTQSRRQFAYLIPHGWQPSFRKDEVRKWSMEKLSNLSYPSGTTDRVREAIDFFLLNPFINSGGTRYRVCLVAEDLLLEDFPEPDPKEEVPSKLFKILKLDSRWGLSRLQMEDALLEHGLEVIHELQLDPELFRLVAIPADLYTQLGPERGWGQKEMWTHYDGYRVLEGGKLQALAGGDNRFGGTHDIVSFSNDYASAKVFARFAVVQRKRMMDWQNKEAQTGLKTM